jgi:hypothetical protein
MMTGSSPRLRLATSACIASERGGLAAGLPDGKKWRNEPNHIYLFQGLSS